VNRVDKEWNFFTKR